MVDERFDAAFTAVIGFIAGSGETLLQKQIFRCFAARKQMF